MGRPKFPTGVVMPVEMIRRIRADQEAYDKDPERWERRKREEREAYEREQQEQDEYYRHQKD